MGKMSTTDRAMLKVAYLLSSINGEIGKLECEAFKALCFNNASAIPGTAEVNAFLEEVVTEAEKFQKLKKFYNAEEQILAFISKVGADCEKLKADPVVSRKAFAVWIGLCMADGKYSEVERQLIKTLQQIFIRKIDFSNVSSELRIGALMGAFMPGVGSLITAGKIGKAIVSGEYKAQESEQVISDEFLKQLEDDCKMLNDLKMQIDSTADAVQKASLQNSFNYIEDSLKELIKNGLN
ncbi:MAG: hypothetical protein IJV93_06215 [Lentisphaeria bacterium]|nr:hypothetical protein [Lentisphaeria bacterium]